LAQVSELREASLWVIPPRVQDKAKSVLFRVLNKDDRRAVGCGFFVTPTLALTVSHVRKECAYGSDMNMIRGLTLDGAAELSFGIMYDDGDNDENKNATGNNLDFMVLKLSGGASRTAFFPITPLESPKKLLGSTNVSLLACGIAMEQEMRAEAHLMQDLTVSGTVISHVGNRHFVYSQTTWDGDSGGCIFFNSKHEVIGLHLEGVNRAKELHDHAQGLDDVSELLNSPPAGTKRARTVDSVRTVGESVRDIISNVTTGGLALFVGCKAVRDAIAGVGSGGGSTL
jgi:V8-like Glu-specific endopeptidase